MSGRLLQADQEKFIIWAKDLAKKNLIKCAKDYAWNHFSKSHGIIEKIFYLRRNYKIEIDWETINVQFFGFADVKKQTIKLNGENLLLNMCGKSKNNYTEDVYTQYADIVGIVGFSFKNDHFTIEMKHKRTKKSVDKVTIKDLNEIIGDSIEEDDQSNDSVHVMVVFGNLNNLRRNNFHMTNNNKG